MREHDRQTRERVLKAAAQLFADRGFKKVTVRDICRTARANVAAVNYHFGDKGGLYREVLQLAADTMRATSEAAREAGAGLPADERLRQYIQVSLCRVMKNGSASWISRLINREIADPTPAFDTLVEQGVRPRIDESIGHRRRDAWVPRGRRARAPLRRQHPRAVDSLRAQPDCLAVPAEAPSAERGCGSRRPAHRGFLAGRNSCCRPRLRVIAPPARQCRLRCQPKPTETTSDGA